MRIAHPPMNNGNAAHQSHFGDDDGFDTDVDHGAIRLLEENARLRALVTQLSTLVLKQVAEQK